MRHSYQRRCSRNEKEPHDKYGKERQRRHQRIKRESNKAKVFGGYTLPNEAGNRGPNEANTSFFPTFALAPHSLGGLRKLTRHYRLGTKKSRSSSLGEFKAELYILDDR